MLDFFWIVVAASYVLHVLKNRAFDSINIFGSASIGELSHLRSTQSISKSAMESLQRCTTP